MQRMTSPEIPGSSTSPFYEIARRPTRNIGLPPATGSKGLTTREGILCGYQIAATAGAAATCRLWDGDANSGELMASLAIPSGGSVGVGPGIDGPYFRIGLYLEVLTGSVEGGVWVKI